MNIKLFLTSCITSLVSLSNISYSMNETYVDECKVKDCLNTIKLLENNYSKHLFWNTSQTDRLLLISNKLFVKQASLFNSIQTLKQLMNYSDEIINKFTNNIRNNSNINLYSNNMMGCDKQLNNCYKINIQNEYNNGGSIVDINYDDLFGFYSKYDEQKLIGSRILQLGNNELKLRITNIVVDIIEGISEVEYYKRCFKMFLNESFINCLKSIDSQAFNNNKNQLYTFINNIELNKKELFNDINTYCETRQKLFQDFNTKKVLEHYDNTTKSAQELFDLAMNKIIMGRTDEVMNCNPEQNISDGPVFTADENDYIKQVHAQNINNVKLMYDLKKLNLGFLYNKKNINNMKNIISNTKKYNELKDKIMNETL